MMVNPNTNDKTLSDFKNIVKKSKVEYTEWKIGGILSSCNSKAGFKTIAIFIKNENDLYEEDSMKS